MNTSKSQRLSTSLYTCASILVILIFSLLSTSYIRYAKADVIMMNDNGVPSIVENDDFEQDIILMPGMNSMIMNDELVL